MSELRLRPMTGPKPAGPRKHKRSGDPLEKVSSDGGFQAGEAGEAGRSQCCQARMPRGACRLSEESQSEALRHDDLATIQLVRKQAAGPMPTSTANFALTKVRTWSVSRLGVLVDEGVLPQRRFGRLADVLPAFVEMSHASSTGRWAKTAIPMSGGGTLEPS